MSLNRYKTHKTLEVSSTVVVVLRWMFSDVWAEMPRTSAEISTPVLAAAAAAAVTCIHQFVRTSHVVSCRQVFPENGVSNYWISLSDQWPPVSQWAKSSWSSYWPDVVFSTDTESGGARRPARRKGIRRRFELIYYCRPRYNHVYSSVYSRGVEWSSGQLLVMRCSVFFADTVAADG